MHVVCDSTHCSQTTPSDLFNTEFQLLHPTRQSPHQPSPPPGSYQPPPLHPYSHLPKSTPLYRHRAGSSTGTLHPLDMSFNGQPSWPVPPETLILGTPHGYDPCSGPSAYLNGIPILPSVKRRGNRASLVSSLAILNRHMPPSRQGSY